MYKDVKVQIPIFSYSAFYHSDPPIPALCQKIYTAHTAQSWSTRANFALFCYQ